MKLGANYLGDDRCQFTVWGPKLDSAAVLVVSQDHRLEPMTQQDDGYWTLTATNIPPGTRYMYQLNGGESRPDPASHLQPEGVHGASEVVDHQFPWTDQDWAGVPLESMIIYELHVGTFTPEGTFDAIVARLPELRELGITAIELMPIAQYPGNHPPQLETHDHDYRNWGYDGAYVYGVQNSYGGPAGLKRLVNACHQAGIAVILDVVYNHFGPEGNYISAFGPYFTEVYLTPWGSAVNYDDRHSPEVRNFFMQNAVYWLRHYHLDGLRLDAIHAIYDLGARHFLEELSETVATLSAEVGRQLYLIAESDLNDPRIIRPIAQGGYGIDAQWSDDFHHALYALLTGDRSGYYEDFGRCEHLAKAFQQSFVYDWQYSPHRQRYHGKAPKGCATAQFIVCIQNHDQIGNRLMGERLSQLVSFAALKLAAGAVILSPYIPMLFMGEEYGETAPFTYFVSHSDPALIEAVRQGRKQEFAAFHCEGEPLDPEAVDTFLMCKLNWQQRQTGQQQTLWSFYQKLIQLRHTLPTYDQIDGEGLEVNCAEADRVIWWRRWDDKRQILCLMNFSQHQVTLQSHIKGDRWQKILDSAEEKWLGSGSSLPPEIFSVSSLQLSPQSIALYERA
ncbi:malto-oligosyltrehalose trehalohydrolase [Pantanalinema rosaneae CENA516]|uniref:malto-oligosyltrehalose trehalohydrolase n=1 Tax=Pantanalinema rosaneae TaxID=1620701 RepID=UPI003D6F1223